jgi:hypothetical protein
MDIKEIGWEGLIWIDLAEEREKWQAIMNKVTNLQAA